MSCHPGSDKLTADQSSGFLLPDQHGTGPVSGSERTGLFTARFPAERLKKQSE